MPDGLRAGLDEAAKQHGLSLNQEIVWRLDQSFDPRADMLPIVEQISRALVALNNPAKHAVELIGELREHESAWRATIIARELIQAQETLYAVIEKLMPPSKREEDK
jgi:Arc-like DNA binding domain